MKKLTDFELRSASGGSSEVPNFIPKEEDDFFGHHNHPLIRAERERMSRELRAQENLDFIKSLHSRHSSK